MPVKKPTHTQPTKPQSASSVGVGLGLEKNDREQDIEIVSLSNKGKLYAKFLGTKLAYFIGL